PGGESGAEGKPEGYGLSKPSARATIVWKDPKKPGKKQSRTLEFGIDIPGTDVTAARVPGTSQILFVPAALAASVRKPADEFKSKDVFGGASLDVASIDVARGRGRLTLAKRNGIWWLEQPIADLADREVADRLSNDLGSTRSDGNSVYATHEGQVFTIGNSIVDDLSKEAEVFRDKRLVRFERSDVSGITASAVGGKPRIFARQQAGWTLGGKAVLASVADDLMTAILDVETSSFLDDAPLAAFAAHPAETELEIRLAAGPPWKVSIYPFRGEYAAVVSRRPGAFGVSSDAIAKVKGAIEKAAAAPRVTPAPRPTK
ncbi:MAG TPA: DUF4340 domain-containing protein, partial [Thermoanaerobaculia bacterium]|nr:DUF4340 domain-containing protein [Thermoanaerobaculia bacterium]